MKLFGGKQILATPHTEQLMLIRQVAPADGAAQDQHFVFVQQTTRVLCSLIVVCYLQGIRAEKKSVSIETCYYAN